MSIARAKSPLPCYDTDLNDNVFRELKKKRGSIKGRLTLFAKFVNSFDTAQLSEKQVTEFKLRCDAGKLLLSDFNDVQSSIEELVSESDLIQQLEIREGFENSYFDVMSTASNLIKHQVTDCLNEESKCSGNSLVKLPTIALPSFDGSYDDWLGFRDTFLSMIHNSKRLDNIQKFHYLRLSVVKNAAQVIKSIEFTSENYCIAWDLLNDRYNNTNLLVHNHIKSIVSLPNLNKESSFHLRKLIDSFYKNLRALKTLGEPTESWDTIMIYILVTKLDANVEKEWEQYKNTFFTSSNKREKLEDLLSFLKNKADTLDMIKAHHNSSSNNIVEPSKKLPQQKVHTFATTGNTNYSTNYKRTHNCIMCKGSHALYACNKFHNLSIKDRLEFVNCKNLCINCLRLGHTVSDCYFGPCKQCNKKHNSLLHGESNGEDALLAVGAHYSQPNPDSNFTSTMLNTTEQSCSQICHTEHAGVHAYALEKSLKTVLLSTAIVEVAGNDNVYHKARALLDSGSQKCIITSSLRDKLKTKSIQSTHQIIGIGQSVTQTGHSCEIQLKSLNGDYHKRISCLVLNRITSAIPSVNINHSSLNIPQNINLADPSFHEPSQIDILIGADCFWDLLVDGRIRLSKGPFLQNTSLGWIISGPAYANSLNNQVQCNFNLSEINDQLKKFWEIEEISNPNQFVTAEERICENLFNETTKRLDSGRFVVQIPLKESADTLGDSYSIAENRFLALERRLDRSPQYKQLYTEFMQEYLRLGHMTRIDNYSVPYYFLPHHGVLREHSSTTKLRVVFNASQKTSSGKSLNDIQMIGPALQNDLFSILLRFRQWKYVVCADIEKMFRQILIHENQKRLQLILWRENKSDPLGVYKLNTVTYGTASAPYLSIRCIKQLGFECKDDDVSRTVLNDFYVDDLITGNDCPIKLATICKKVTDICMSACFPLRKWTLNSDDIPLHVEDSGNSSKCLSFEDNCSNKTLGIGWFNNSDELHFTTKISNVDRAMITKRLILSVVSQIYDPLGLLSPIIIIGKILLQKLWLHKLGWDDVIPNDVMSSFKEFIESLHCLHSVRVPRHVIGCSYSHIELHIFTDASESAYGACAYIRTLCDDNDDVAGRLLCSKSRVAPVKPVSIPRLELCGALVGAKLCDKILKSVQLQFDSIVFWTDSTIVLGWLQMSPHQLKTFVRNRVVEINDLTGTATWRHVSTKLNPADLLSRGTKLSELNSSSMWWNGPDFLYEQVKQWSHSNHSVPDPASLPEIKVISLSTTCSENYKKLIEFNRFSNVNRLQRACAYVMRFINNLRTKDKTQRVKGPLTVQELDNSLLIIVKQVQMQSFPDEYNSLINKLNLKSKRSLSCLNIFLDENNIIRVGGRLVNSDSFSYNKKHPILLCSKHPFTLVLFRCEHIRLLHAGPQLLLSQIRENWWPLGRRNLARKTVHQCVRCCRMKGKTPNLIMGNLPSERLNAGFPFSVCGVDYAGPFFILNRKGRGAKLEKGYLCLFVCFTTRALHLELVTSLTTEGFILALKRFISRRGKPTRIFSDHGRNFVGAAREFTDFLKNNTRSIVDYASYNQIEFKFIPPYAPHFGGLWEAGVKSCKHHLTRVIGNVNLTYEEFNTVLVQIEAVLNSRPITPLSSDSHDLNPLTPAHFLIGRPLTSPPEREATAAPAHTLSRYQRIEQLRQAFWRRWATEYISELQRRSKWHTNKDDIDVGTLVLIKDDNLPPLRWKLGRIITLFPGKDGVSRVAVIRTATGIVHRAHSKICPLPVCDATPETTAANTVASSVHLRGEHSC